MQGSLTCELTERQSRDLQLHKILLHISEKKKVSSSYGVVYIRCLSFLSCFWSRSNCLLLDNLQNNPSWLARMSVFTCIFRHIKTICGSLCRTACFQQALHKSSSNLAPCSNSEDPLRRTPCWRPRLWWMVICLWKRKVNPPKTGVICAGSCWKRLGLAPLSFLNFVYSKVLFCLNLIFF